MRQLLLLASATLLQCGLCGAATCTSGTLANYIDLGSGGCTIGTNRLYDFQTLTGIAGATAILPANVSIMPSGGNSDPGLTAFVKATATSSNELQLLFTYQISGTSFIGDSITLSGSSQTADGAITDLQNFCAAGTFGPDGVTGCTGAAGSLLTLNGVQNQDSAAVGQASFLSVTDDFTLDGGLTGTASGGAISDRFAAVPEPSTYLLSALGLALGIGTKLRFRRRS